MAERAERGPMTWMRVLSLLIALACVSCNSPALPQPESAPTREVNNNGVRISYRVYGQGHPLVLIHGWSNEGRYWEEFGYISALSPEYQLIVPDLRGHGTSDTPIDRNFSDEACASDVRSVMDDIGIDSAHIFGFSLGGWVAFELAATSPERVRGLVVLGAHPYAEDLRSIRDTYSVSSVNLGFWEAAKAPLSAESKQRLANFDPQVLRAMLPDHRVDRSERLNAWQRPGLMIVGTKDWRFEDMKRYASSNPHWQLVPVEGADHGSSWLEADRIVPALQAFLRRSAGS